MKISTKIIIGIAILVGGFIYFANKRVETRDRLQMELYEKSLPLLEMGQSIEAATGILGQQYWTQQMLALQKAGGLKTPKIAQMMLLQANVTYRYQGGIKNKVVLDMLTKIAPFIGMHQLSPDEAAKLIDLAGDAGIPAIAENYMKFLAQMQADFKTSEARTFGEYIINMPIVPSTKSLLDLGREVEATINTKNNQSSANLLLELGQSLEAATGAGMGQQYWAKQITGLQTAGGLKSPEIAQQILLQANVTFRKQDGIENKAILDMLVQIAPFIGEQQLSADEASNLIGFAGIADVPATAEDFRIFFIKLQIGVKTSKAKTFGEFLVNSQKSLTDYILAGGTLEKGIGLYSAARGGIAGELEAVITMEELIRLITELPQQSQKAIERVTETRWQGLSTDQKMDAFLQFMGGLKPESRERTLKRWGFPIETAEITEKFLSPQAIAAASEAQKQLQDIIATSKNF